MATRLGGTYYDLNGTAWTINLHDTDYVGGIVPVAIQQARLQYQSNARDSHAPVLSSAATVAFQIDGGTLESLVTDFIGAAEQRFRLEIRKGADLFWVGLILTDDVTKQDKEWPYIFEVKATDGLALLKDIDYNNAGSDYTGKERCTDHLINALNKIGTADLFGTPLLSTCVKWFSSSHASTLIDPLYLSRFDHRRFIQIDTSGVKSYTSCYDVIKQITEAWGARILLTEGTFKVIQVNEYEGGTFDLFNYTTGKASTTATTSATYRKTDATNITRLDGGTRKYLPAYNRTIVKFKHYQAQSVIPGNSIAFADYAGPEIDSQSATAKLLFSFNYNFLAAFNVVADFKPLRFILRLKVQIGSYYLTRTASVDSTTGAVTYTDVTWENSLNYFEIATSIASVNNVTYYGSINGFITPEIPADGDITVNGAYNRAYTANGNSISPTATASLNFYNAYFEVVAGGTVESRSNQYTYSAENDTANNSAKKEIEVAIGDGPTSTALGSLQVYDGSGWVSSSGWKVDAIDGTDDLGQVLAQELLYTRAKPAQVINATYLGDYTPINSIYLSSEDHIPISCTVDMIEGKTTGEFVQIDSGGVAVTDKTREAPFEPDGEPLSPITPAVIDNTRDGSGTPTITPAIEQSLLYKAKVVGTASDITSGATVTSIDIEQIGEDGVIRESDVIQLVDINTGQVQSFIVTSDVAATDTSISVSSTTATSNFAEGSIVTTDQIETLKTRKRRFKQAFANHSSQVLTITANSGTLPDDDTYIDVLMDGVELADGDWVKSGSDITIQFTHGGANFVVKFWI